jgi:hypothetical protein
MVQGEESKSERNDAFDPALPYSLASLPAQPCALGAPDFLHLVIKSSKFQWNFAAGKPMRMALFGGIDTGAKLVRATHLGKDLKL